MMRAMVYEQQVDFIRAHILEGASKAVCYRKHAMRIEVDKNRYANYINFDC